MSEGRPQIALRVAGPAGGGKSTLILMLRALFAEHELPCVMPKRLPRRDFETQAKCLESLRRRGTILVVSEEDC